MKNSPQPTLAMALFTRLLHLIVFLVVTGPAFAATFAGVAVPPPPAPKPQTDTFFDVRVDDPYRFLEQVGDADVQAWMRAQADATTAILGKLPGRAELLQRMRDLDAAVPGSVTSIQRTEGGRLFFERRNPGEEHFKLVMRESADGAERILVDPEALSKSTGKPHAIMDYAASRDGKQLAYSMQVGGGEIGTLHVVDIATGKSMIEPVDRIRYAGVSWLLDGSGFFYSRLAAGYEQKPRAQRFDDRTRHFRALDAAGTDRVVMSPSRNPELKLPAYASGYVTPVPGTRLAAMVVYLGVESNKLLYVADLDAAAKGTAQWRQLVRIEDQVSDIAFGGDYVYLRSAKGAPRYQILRMPLAAADIARAEVIVPPGESVIADIAGARDALYFTRRDGATLSLWRVPHTVGVDVLKVPLPFEGRVTISTADQRDDGVVLLLGSWIRSTKPFVYDTRSRSIKPLALARTGEFDAPEGIEAREVMVTSHDGVKVPLSILSRRGLKLDGRNPTIVYGYGAYGLTEDPAFNPRVYAWLERGGVYAIAHVRGGGAFGDEWHQAGRKATKPNTWKDAIAAAEWLVAQGYTTPARMAIYGGSAGGILVGRAITERPDLFAAAVPAVGVLDSIRKETSANGPANIPEYGTVAKKDEFPGLLTMSSYHAIKDGAKYPAVMLVHGVNDIRVDVWQSTKFGARVAAASSSGKPVLLRLEYDSGHGQGSSRAQLQERAADIWSFLLWQFGDPAFQPK